LKQACLLMLQAHATAAMINSMTAAAAAGLTVKKLPQQQSW
jgi:hypothetical protein